MLGARVAGRFDVVRMLGRGGFGEVYEATHSSLGGRRAVKVLRADMSANPELFARFEREAEVLYRLNAPQIVKVEEFGCLGDGRPFMVMEYAEGQRLDDLIHACHPLPVLRSLRIAREVLLGLAEAHLAGVLHRDLKAENIIVADQPRFGERVKILDMGISFLVGQDRRLTRATRTVGTPEYMAPEQWRGEAGIDGRADLFALGVLLYEMLMGEVPFPRDDDGPAGVYRRLMNDQPLPIGTVRDDLPAGLDGLILRLLARDRGRRPADAIEALRELETVRARLR